MNLIVRYPETEEGKLMLQQRIAQAHVAMIKDYIKKLPWEPDQKVALFEEVKKQIKQRAEREGGSI